VIPTGTSDDALDRPELARLSLPSRITYLTAVANIPLLVVGSRQTAAARFVEDMEIGLVCDYTPENFRQAVSELSSQASQLRMRKQAAYLAQWLSAEGMDTWIWRSLERKRPINHRFEQLGRKLSDASAVVTAFEINHLHGTGPLVNRIVAGTPNILSIHSMDLYDGEHYFGDVSLFISHDGLSRKEATGQVIDKLGDNQVRQILCVPYRADDLVTSIALAEHYQAPLGVYIMDDQNVYARVIPDKLMREFLTKCNICFATHPELRDAYEEKYGLKFYLLPAIVPHELVYQSSDPDDFWERPADAGVLIGSLWSKRWYDMLSDAACGAGVRLDWYGNTNYPWMDIEIGQERQHGIVAHGLIAETELVEKMKQASFVVVPTGTLDARDDRKELSLLSLPGRIILAMATSNTPVIIMGSKDSGAAHFVERFGVGVTCDYDAQSLRKAVDYVTNPQAQRGMRNRAAELAPQFAIDRMSDWVWDSIRRGHPADLRFEALFCND
jgi:glycosyltransferase involved in cell wall biosynthesis